MVFRSLLESLKLGRSSTPTRSLRHAPTRRKTPCSLGIETLEDRCVPAAVLSAWDVWVAEGDTDAPHAEVTVTLSEPHSNAVSVNYRTVAGTAQAGSDFDAVSGTLTFKKNELSKTIRIPIRDDRTVESDETFFVQFDGIKGGAKIANNRTQITIADNEPRISIYGTSKMEGTSGLTPFEFTVSLSQACDLPVSVNWTTEDGSAKAGTDYVAASDTLVFEANETSKTITVMVNGDRELEPNESFNVKLTNTPNSYAAISQDSAVGSITDSSPRITIGDAYYYYGYDGATITFTVSLSTAYDEIVTVDFATSDGTMAAGANYVAAIGPLTFDKNVTTQTITIDLLDLSNLTDYDYFYVNLSNASSNAVLSDAEAAGYFIYYYDYGYGYYDYGYYDYGYYGYYY